MISYIIGNVIQIEENHLIVENNGLGYMINSSLETLSKLNLNNEYKIYTSMQVREDDISLYGFLTNDELEMFTLLTRVSSVGAKSALGILSSISISDIKRAIVTNDIDTLTKAKGIGKKTASRIILELVDKVKSMPIPENVGSSTIPPTNENIDVAKEALINLGYQRNDIDRVLTELKGEDLTLEVLIKESLKRLI